MDFRKLKERLKSKDNKNKAKILIRGLKTDIKSVLKNLFGICDKNFEGTNILINKIDIDDLEIDLFYVKSDKKFLKDYEKDLIDINSFDFIINCESVLNKKLDITEIANIKYLNEMNKSIITIFTDVEFLDNKEFLKAKEIFLSKVEGIEVFSVLNSTNYDLCLNEWKSIASYIVNNILENKESFIKSQVVDINIKKDLANNTILAYVDMIKELDNNTLDKDEIIFLEEKMIEDILNIYSRTDEKLIDKIRCLISDTVDKLINRKILKLKEKEKLNNEEEKIYNNFNDKYNDEVVIEAIFTVHDTDDEIIYEKNIYEEGKSDLDIDERVETIINRVIEEKLDCLFNDLKHDIIKEIKKELNE